MKANDIFIGTYIISAVDSIDYAPKIALSMSPVKLNVPVTFRVNITQALPGSWLYFTFGDGNSQLFMLGAKKDLYMEITYTYKNLAEYTTKAVLSNYITTQSTEIQIPMEKSLSDFTLKVVNSWVNDVTDDVVFQLVANGINSAVKVDKITFRDDESSSPVVIQQDYTFTPESQFTLQYRYKYKTYGNFKPYMEVVNSVGSVKASTEVRVGINVGNFTAIVLNSYATVGEAVRIYLEIDSGNGFDVNVKYTDSDEMVIPWDQIASSNAFDKKTQKQNVQFTNSRLLMYPLVTYSRAGTFSITIKLSNAFNSVSWTLCSRVIIAAASLTPIPNADCPLLAENIDLQLNNASQSGVSIMKVSRGFENLFNIAVKSCVGLSSLNYYWTITKLVKRNNGRVPRPIDSLCFIETEGSSLLLVKNQLEFGDYNFTAYVVDELNPSNYRQLASKTINIIVTSLIAKIQGPQMLELGIASNYELDFYSGSYDPDAETKDNLYFDIVCFDQSPNVTDPKAVDNFAYGRNFDFTQMGFNLVFSYEKIRFFERKCFKDGMDVAQMTSEILFDEVSYTISMNMSSLSLNATSLLPLLVKLYVYDEGRLSSATQSVGLNASNSFLAIPSKDLDQMAKQLDKLDDLAAKDPKSALRFVSNFADAINTFGSDSSSSEVKIIIVLFIKILFVFKIY